MPGRPGTAAAAAESAVVLAPAPVLADHSLQTFSGSASSHAFDTSTLDVAALDVFAAIATNGGSATLTSFQGADDTSANVIAHTSSAPRLHFREMTIVSTLDPTWTLSLGGGSRPAICGLSFSGLGSFQAVAPNTGTGTTPTHPAMLVTGGPANLLVVEIMAIEGSHITNPPTIGDGRALVDTDGAGANNPSDSNRMTMAVAAITLASSGLSWVGGEVTLPAVSWSVPDAVGMDWRCLRLVGTAP